MSNVIAQVANFVTPTSGGLRTALEHLADGYAAAGHRVLRITPGPCDEVEEMPWGRWVRLKGVELPGTGYRVLPSPRRVLEALDGADRLEVHDRTTLRALAPQTGLQSLVVSHERLDRWLAQWLPRRLPLERVADARNAELAAAHGSVVCTTPWAAAEFDRIGVAVRRVPLGVDTVAFRPGARDLRLRRAHVDDGELLLVAATRLSKEKRPELLLGCVSALVDRRVRVRLVVCGDGPLRSRLQRDAAHLPVTFVGHVRERADLAALMASADVMLAPGPVETFGLAALEACASGTPVVANVHSALPGVLGSAGEASASSGRSFADAVQRLLEVPEGVRRARARNRALELPWSSSVAGFLRVHGLADGARVREDVPA